MTQDMDSRMAVFPSMDDEELLFYYERTLMMMDFWSNAKGRAEQDIRRRIGERGGTALPNNDFACELHPKRTYDQWRFKPLLEIFNEADLKTCYEPSKEEVVTIPEKWITTKVKALSKRYGPEAERVVENASVEQAPSLTFKRRPDTKDN